MKYGDKLTFWCLISENSIQIPEIQRDYVQGRDTDIVKRNKETFIKKLVSATVSGEEIDLNFTYGKKNNQYFVPIDGQQRLTTLFLLHFYLSVVSGKINDDKKTFQNFSYKTRRTSDKFLTLLLKNSGDFANMAQVADNIESSSWYLNSFKHDLTIRSMLNVLKQIEIEFKDNHYSDWLRYYSNIFKINDYGCPITFMYIDLDMTGDDNELYVKMNSRGKQLTDFENFKSDLYGFIEKPLLGIDLSTTANEQETKNDFDSLLSVIDIEKFKKSIDGNWLDTFWNFAEISDFYERSIEDRALYIDTLFKNIFHYLFINNIAICGACDNEDSPMYSFISPKSKTNQSAQVSMLFLDQYINSSIPGIALTCRKALLMSVRDFIFVMDYFESNQNLINDFLCLNNKSQIKDFNINGYKERLYLAVLCVLGANNVSCSSTEFLYYKRTLKNILSNTEVDSETKFVNFIKGIKESSRIVPMFENYTLDSSQSYIFNSFDPSICEEEKMKNILRYKNPSLWENAIDSAEKRADYLNGQIGFVFDFLNITETDYNNAIKRDAFLEYSNLLADVFQYKVENDKSNYLHRTLLTYVGNDAANLLSLFSERNNSIYSFCSNKEDDFRHRKHDWRGQLIENTYFKEKFREMYAGFVSYKRSNPRNRFSDFARSRIAAYTENYADCNNALISVVVKYDWEMPFKNNSHKYYFLKENQSISFMKTTQRNEWVDIHLYYLSRLLNNRGIRLKLTDDGTGRYEIQLHHNRGLIIFNSVTETYELKNDTISHSNADDFIRLLESSGKV